MALFVIAQQNDFTASAFFTFICTHKTICTHCATGMNSVKCHNFLSIECEIKLKCQSFWYTPAHTNRNTPAHTLTFHTHNSAIVVALFFLLLWPGHQHHHHHHQHRLHHRPLPHRLRHRARHRCQPHLRPVNSCSIVVAYLFHNTLIFDLILLVVSSSCRFPFPIYVCIHGYVCIGCSWISCFPFAYVCLN